MYSGPGDFSDPADHLAYMANKFGPPPQQPKPPGIDRFGGLKPFEHHHIPEEMKDHFSYAGHN